MATCFGSGPDLEHRYWPGLPEPVEYGEPLEMPTSRASAASRTAHALLIFWGQGRAGEMTGCGRDISPPTYTPPL